MRLIMSVNDRRSFRIRMTAPNSTTPLREPGTSSSLRTLTLL